ncbi:hypothetical protein [Streptomyces sp. LaPpAH-108]|uniref:hypothetical protein n=1 Tax=Streptomyces sp. LaPpAH-108 TaxID=1155714 RepID=UPI00039F29F1|nr:hypothetical protein [Streptomyces sp. LaPpAH-108]
MTAAVRHEPPDGPQEQRHGTYRASTTRQTCRAPREHHPHRLRPAPRTTAHHRAPPRTTRHRASPRTALPAPVRPARRRTALKQARTPA